MSHSPSDTQTFNNGFWSHPWFMLHISTKINKQIQYLLTPLPLPLLCITSFWVVIPVWNSPLHSSQLKASRWTYTGIAWRYCGNCLTYSIQSTTALRAALHVSGIIKYYYCRFHKSQVNNSSTSLLFLHSTLQNEWTLFTLKHKMFLL